MLGLFRNIGQGERGAVFASGVQRRTQGKVQGLGEPLKEGVFVQEVGAGRAFLAEARAKSRPGGGCDPQLPVVVGRARRSGRGSAELGCRGGALGAEGQERDMKDHSFPSFGASAPPPCDLPPPNHPSSEGGWVTSAQVAECCSPCPPQESPHRPEHRPGPHHPGHRRAGHPLGYGREIHPQAAGHRAAGESVRGQRGCWAPRTAGTRGQAVQVKRRVSSRSGAGVLGPPPQP